MKKILCLLLLALSLSAASCSVPEDAPAYGGANDGTNDGTIDGEPTRDASAATQSSEIGTEEEILPPDTTDVVDQTENDAPPSTPPAIGEHIYENDRAYFSYRILKGDVRAGGTITLSLSVTFKDTMGEYIYEGSSTFSEVGADLAYISEDGTRTIISDRITTEDVINRIFVPGETRTNKYSVYIPQDAANGRYALQIRQSGAGGVWVDDFFTLGDTSVTLTPESSASSTLIEPPANDYEPFASENTLSDTYPMVFSYRVMEADIQNKGIVKIAVTMTNASDQEYHYKGLPKFAQPYALLYTKDRAGNLIGDRSYPGFWIDKEAPIERTYAPGESQTAEFTFHIYTNDRDSGYFSFRFFLLNQDAPIGVWFEDVFYLAD